MRKYIIIFASFAAAIAYETMAAAVTTATNNESEQITMETTQFQREETTEVVVKETEKVIPILDSVPLDAELQAWIYEYSYNAHISPYLIYAIIEKESRFNPDCIADTAREYSIGLMQINTYWHKERIERLGVTDLTDPKQNITVGIDYLSELLNYKEGTTLEWALMAYNGGQSYADKKAANGTISEYASSIILRSMELEREGEQYE